MTGVVVVKATTLRRGTVAAHHVIPTFRAGRFDSDARYWRRAVRRSAVGATAGTPGQKHNGEPQRRGSHGIPGEVSGTHNMTEDDLDTAQDLRYDLAREAQQDRAYSLHRESAPAAFVRYEQIRGYMRQGWQSFIEAGLVLMQAYAAQDWTALGMDNFEDYCAGFGISKSVGYDLVRIAEFYNTHPTLQPKILDAGQAKMRLLLPVIESATPDDPLDEMLDAAGELSWNDLRQRYNGDDSEKADQRGRVPRMCPRCNAQLWLSRAADVFTRGRND